MNAGVNARPVNGRNIADLASGPVLEEAEYLRALV
jgi:hypothetical protein